MRLPLCYTLSQRYVGAELAIDPKYALAWDNKGLALQAMGKTPEAEAAFHRARELGYTR